MAVGEGRISVPLSSFFSGMTIQILHEQESGRLQVVRATAEGLAGTCHYLLAGGCREGMPDI